MRATLTSRIGLAVIAIIGAALVAHNMHTQYVRLRLDLAGGPGFADPGCAAAYCDSAVFWLAGRLARLQRPEEIYQPAAFFAYGARALPHHLAALPFFYPPPALLPAAAISWPGVAAGYYGFSAVSLLGSVWLLRQAAISWLCIALGLFSPAGLWCLYLGQFGMLCGALLICGLSLLAARPGPAGGLLAVLCIKPQYALLLPVVVLAGRRWRAVAAAVVLLALLVALSIVCFGWQAWAQYAGAGRAQEAMLAAPFGKGYEALGNSVFWMLRSLGAGLGVAYLAQAIAAAVAAVAAWFVWRRPAANRVALTVLLTLLASPYGYTDDMVAYSIMLPTLARRDTPRANLALGCLWLAPALVGRFVERVGFLPTPLLVVAAVGVASSSFFAKKEPKKLLLF